VLFWRMFWNCHFEILGENYHIWKLSLQDRFMFKIMIYQGFWNNQVNLYEFSFFLVSKLQTKIWNIMKFWITEFWISQVLLCTVWLFCIKCNVFFHLYTGCSQKPVTWWLWLMMIKTKLSNSKGVCHKYKMLLCYINVKC
jgi:hypothetical protein